MKTGGVEGSVGTANRVFRRNTEGAKDIRRRRIRTILHQLPIELLHLHHIMPLTSSRVFTTKSTATITRPKGHRPANEIGQSLNTPYPLAQQVGEAGVIIF